jgi:signal peptidase I
MASTVLLFATLFSLFAVSLLLFAAFLRWGVRWAKGPSLTFRKSLAVALAIQCACLVIAVSAHLYESSSPSLSTSVSVVELLMQIIVPCTIITKSFRLTFWRGVQAWLPTQIPGIAIACFLFLVYRPFVSEAFVVPTNSMAPTILGEHVTAPCPRCGAPAYGSALMHSSMIERRENPDDFVMICSKELRSCKARPLTEAGGSDRILVNKLVTPRRWDIIAFRLPSDPSVIYIKRLVGLPGEEFQLREGSIWINGKKIEPPEELRGIEYLTSIEFQGRSFTGVGSSAVRLADREHFVLGDFSAQAADSRLWEVGAPGYAPYAVPESHIIGVVTHIYWPISRWRAFR